MLILILIVAFILLMIAILVTVVRRHDAESYTDQERDPFEIELARLAAAGLLYEQEESSYGRPRKSYTVTPAGEAALRTWLREPMNDPGMLRLYFAGIVGPADVVALARERSEDHRERLRQYQRIDDLLAGRKGWEDTQRLAELGRAFEQRCLDFWDGQANGPIRGRALGDQRGKTPERDKTERDKDERNKDERNTEELDNKQGGKRARDSKRGGPGAAHANGKRNDDDRKTRKQSVGESA